MTVTSPPLPSSRELADLWPHFQPWQPHELWLGLLLLHRVEACVTVAEKQALDALALHVLAAFPAAAALSLPDLHHRTSLPEVVLRSALGFLSHQGCLRPAGPEAWQLTTAGDRARDARTVPLERRRRRVFHFCDGTQDGLPAFVRWDHPPTGLAVPAPKTQWTFTPTALQQCVEAPDAWKTAHGFPAEVCRLEQLGANHAAPSEEWEKVILHHVLRLPLAVAAGRRCVGFALSPPSWGLLPAPPLFHLDNLADATLFVGAELSPPPLAAWGEAWDLVRRPLGLPHGEVLHYQATAHGPRVTIRLPAATGPRKKPLPAGETWLLAGTGLFRCAARVEFREE